MSSAPMLKYSSERCVCAPQSLSAGTFTTPMLSLSSRVSAIGASVGGLRSLDILTAHVFRKMPVDCLVELHVALEHVLLGEPGKLMLHIGEIEPCLGVDIGNGSAQLVRRLMEVFRHDGKRRCGGRLIFACAVRPRKGIVVIGEAATQGGEEPLDEIGARVEGLGRGDECARLPGR